MSLSQRDISSQIMDLDNDDVLVFRTMANNKNSQFFIVASVPRTYNTFKVCVFNGLDDLYTVYEDCGMVFSLIDGYTLNNSSFNPNEKYQQVKITERHGASDSPAIEKTNAPIDMKSVKVLHGKSFEEVVDEVVRIRKEKISQRQKEAEEKRKNAEKISKQEKLIEVELHVSAKTVIHREEVSRTNSFYSYDNKTIKQKCGLNILIDVFNSCISHYGFDEKKVQNLDKESATELGRIYIEFLKYLSDNNINFIEDNYCYTSAWKKYGYGRDKDYVLVVSEPIIKVGAGIRDYIANTLGEENSIQFYNEVSSLLEKMNKNNKSK